MVKAKNIMKGVHSTTFFLGGPFPVSDSLKICVPLPMENITLSSELRRPRTWNWRLARTAKRRVGLATRTAQAPHREHHAWKTSRRKRMIDQSSLLVTSHPVISSITKSLGKAQRGKSPLLSLTVLARHDGPLKPINVAGASECPHFALI